MKIPKKLGFVQAINCIEGVDTSDKPLEIDFSKTTFSEPSGSLLLVRWIAKQQIRRNVSIKWGGTPDPRYVPFDKVSPHDRWLKYQLFSGFYNAVNGGDVQPFREDERTRNKYVPYSVIEIGTACKMLQDGDGKRAQHSAEEIALRITRQILEDVSAATAAAFTKSLQEIIENVIFYAGGVSRCYLMAQFTPEVPATPSNKRILQIAIMDEGCGLLERLKRSESDSDHLNAIERALVAGVSSSNQRGRGIGLATLLKASSAGGSMFMGTGSVTGVGKASIYESGQRQTMRLEGRWWPLDVSDLNYGMSGTFVGLKLFPESVNFTTIENQIRDEFKPDTGVIIPDK